MPPVQDRAPPPPPPPRGDALAAAAELFAAHGFEGVSFRDLTAATGMKRPLLLYHYGSKEALWQEAMRHIVTRFDAAMATHALPPLDAPDAARVPVLLRAYIETLLAVPAYGRVLIREGVRTGPRLDWLVANFVPSFAQRFTLADPALAMRLRGTMLRDVMIAAPLVATALGPLIEASTAAATRRPSAGIHPMSRERRDELVALLTDLLLRAA